MNKRTRKLVFLVVDVETSGPIKAKREIIPYHNLLEVGAIEVIATHNQATMGKHFHRYIKPVTEYYDPIAITKTSGKSLEFYREKGVDPEKFVEDFTAFLRDIIDKTGRKVMLASDNPEFDAGWIRFYVDLYGYDAHTMLHHNPISIKDLLRGITKNYFTSLYKLPRKYSVELPHTHHALDDAKRNAHILAKIIRELI